MAETKNETAPKAAEADQSELLKSLLARVEAAEARAAAAEAKASVTAPDTPAKKRLAKTKANSHRATRRGYVKGELFDEGEIIPPDVVVSDEWMEEIEGNGRRARAMQEALDPSPKDVDLTQVGVAGLKAMAAERGINPKGLSEADLIAAINAEREPTI
jgi:hypothetical protein